MIIKITLRGLEVVDVLPEDLVGRSIVLASGVSEILDYDNYRLHTHLVYTYEKSGELYVVIPEKSDETHLLAEIPKETKDYSLERKSTVVSSDDIQVVYKSRVGEYKNDKKGRIKKD